ncbi:MAG TPA: hypothetical protein PL005_15790, partial [Candidatus Hydrogenedentes bacterium]|nr:hypothetical protein [Candidatus Hydrogenedentota bacterium]
MSFSKEHPRFQPPRRVARPLTALLVTAAVCVCGVMGEAHAVKRILLVGDSWAQWPWDMGAFQAVLNGNYGAGVNEVEGEYTALGGSTAAGWAANFTPDEGTFPSPPGHTNMRALDRITWCLNTWPTIDIIHLSISGNDMWSWRTTWTPEQEDALFDTIEANVLAVVSWIRANHPRVKILLADYDYLNITETCTYGMAEFNWPAAILAGTLGFTVGDLAQNKANNQQINQFFARFSERKRDLAQVIDRCDYVQNFGNIQWRVGYVNSLGRFFDPYTVPLPGMAPDYLPFPGGDVTYGTPSLYMNIIDGSQRDAIHLSDQGYRLLFDNCLARYYAGWLADTTA